MVFFVFALKYIVLFNLYNKCVDNTVYCFMVFFFFKILIWLHWVLGAAHRIFTLHSACRIFSCGLQTLSCNMWYLVPWLGIEPGLPALGAWSLSYWTTREVPFKKIFVEVAFERPPYPLPHLGTKCQSEEVTVQSHP